MRCAYCNSDFRLRHRTSCTYLSLCSFSRKTLTLNNLKILLHVCVLRCLRWLSIFIYIIEVLTWPYSERALKGSDWPQVTDIRILRYTNYIYWYCNEYLKKVNLSVQNSNSDVIANFLRCGQQARSGYLTWPDPALLLLLLLLFIFFFFFAKMLTMNI